MQIQQKIGMIVFYQELLSIGLNDATDRLSTCQRPVESFAEAHAENSRQKTGGFVPLWVTRHGRF
jgi:hypothetical protein